LSPFFQKNLTFCWTSKEVQDKGKNGKVFVKNLWLSKPSPFFQKNLTFCPLDKMERFFWQPSVFEQAQGFERRQAKLFYQNPKDFESLRLSFKKTWHFVL
jgi:hypothetical protein